MYPLKKGFTCVLLTVCSLLFIIKGYAQQGETPTYKLVQAQDYVYSFEVPLDWQMGQASLEDYDMIMGTSPDSVLQVYYRQYKTSVTHQEAFQNFLVELNPRTQTLAQYTRTTFTDTNKPITAYFAKGHGDYNVELKSFMVGSFALEGKTCLVFLIAPPNLLTESLPLMRHILQL